MDRGLRTALRLLPALALLVILIALSRGAGASNDPPSGGGTVVGDWTVEDARAYTGCSITLRGNLTVASTGKLELNAASLRLDCTRPGQFRVEVRSGGELTLRAGAVVSSSPGLAFGLAVLPGGGLNATDATIRYCGWEWGSEGESAGPYIRSDGCAFVRTTFTGCYYGVMVRDASPVFTDCAFTSNTYGAGLFNSSSTFANCSFLYNVNGANLENCSGSFDNCTFHYQSAFGVLAYRSPMGIRGCDFAFNDAGHVVLMSCDAAVSGCSMREGTYGVYAAEGAPLVSNCTFTACRYGVYLHRSKASIQDCYMDRCGWYGLSASYGAPRVSRCTITLTGYSPVSGETTGTGIQAISSSIVVSDTVVRSNYQGVELRQSSPSLVNLTARENALGVYALTSQVSLSDSLFSLNIQAGVFLNYFSTGRVERCTFIGGRIGLYAEYLSAPEVSNCTFTGCLEGLRAGGCDRGMVVRNCTFDSDSTGVVLEGGSPRILWNDFSSCSNASLLCIGSSPEVLGNRFASCGRDGVTLRESRGRVADNTFTGNAGAGLYCVDSTTEIDNNTFTGNAGSALLVYGNRSAPRVHHNTITGNELGLALSAGAEGEYWANSILGNRVMGISLTASFGDIHHNVISGSERGVSCLYGSAPTVRENELHGCEGGLVCHVSSNPMVWRNRIWNNTRFGISVLGSWPVIVENFIDGGIDGVVVSGCAGAPVLLSLNTIQNASDGLRADNSSLEVRGCTFSGHRHFGAYLYSASSLLSRCRFLLNEGGASCVGGEVAVVECEFVMNNGSGLQLEEAGARVERCLFQRNIDGVLDVGGSRLQVVDGQYLENLAYAIHFGEGTTGDWVVAAGSSSTSERIRLTGNLTVTSGASLRLTNVSLFMALARPGQGAIVVEDGGRLEMLDGCTVTALNPSSKYQFMVMRGAALTLIDGVVQDCGGEWGAPGERGGLNILSDGVQLRNVAFINCTYGLIANGVTATYSGLSFSRCYEAVAAIASSIRLENCSLILSSHLDLELLQGSRAVLVNTTFTRSMVRLAGAGTYLEVIWLLSVNVGWQSRVVVERAQVVLTDAAGRHLLAGYTDEKGWLTGVQVIEYTQNSTSRSERNPYNLSVRYASATASMEKEFVSSETMYIVLYDLQPPLIELTEPAQGALLNHTPVQVGGLAADYETGLARVEASTDGRVWTEAVGLERWSLLLDLPDGNHTIYVRATDAVGNRALLTLALTVDTRVTLLDVIEPTEGLVTRDPVLTVRGSTEAAAKILVNGARAQLDEGAFCVTVELSEGNNTILVSATDAAGNTATIVRSVVLDTMPPLLEVTSPPSGSYASAPETRLSGRTEPGARVLVDGRETLNVGGSFSETIALPASDNYINVTALDAAGNANATLVLVHVDTETPGIEVTHPRSGFRTTKHNVTLNGTAEPHCLIRAGEAVTTSGEDGAFSVELELPLGNSTIIITAVDRAGNENTLIWYIVRARPEAGRSTPWLAAGLAVAIALGCENALLYAAWRRAGGAVRSRERPPPPRGGAPPEALPAELEALLVEEGSGAGKGPPEALPAELEALLVEEGS
ncbi:MAG: right-handed parallel beta-helix repeat-containing protein, partial [Thermoplasmatota archaeon]